MVNALGQKDIYLALNIDDDGFAISIDDTLAQAELVVLSKSLE